MRTLVLVLLLAVVLAVSRTQAQRVFTDRAEFERQKAEYDRQKARYDEFQALSKVPLLAGYDLIPKGRDSEAAPGRAEQLLPNYTGEAVKFQESGPALVEPGNTRQNYFHKGPIPAKKASSPAPRPVVIPRGPGQEFIVPQDDDPALTVSTDTGAGTAAASAFTAPSTNSAFTAPSAASAFTTPSAASPSDPVAARPASFTAPASHALFIARGALPAAPATTAMAAYVQTGAPVRSSVEALFGPAVLPKGVPLRPLGREYQFAPALPHSDFRPGPARPVQADAPASLPFQPHATYGTPTRFGGR